MSTALPVKEFFRPSEVASYVGVSVKTIYYWGQMGQIETVKLPGRSIRIRREEVVRISASSTE